MTDELIAYVAGGLALIGGMAYAILGGADFGGGIWDLFATGKRKWEQRRAIAGAMGPVWEANHVWLIFVVVVMFTCFPRGYAALVTALFVPFHLALVGIMLRGAAFVFRGYDFGRPAGRLVAPQEVGSVADAEATPARPSIWGTVFGFASVITPFLLGAAFGAVTSGYLQLPAGRAARFSSEYSIAWLSPYAIACGLLALSTSAYLAAVYLVVEATGELREDFRRRAIIAGTSTAALAIVVLALACYEAGWFFERLISWQSSPVIFAGLAFFALSAWAVFGRRYYLSRIFAAGEIILLLLGWGLAQQPYFTYPSLTLVNTLGPSETILFVVKALPVGAAVLVPSLWFLFRVFKTQTQPAK